jgi:quinol monooxygenase YgiN
MALTRRNVLKLAGLWAAAGSTGLGSAREGKDMYGLISKIKTVAGQRDALITILIDSTSTMPCCLSYIVAKDSADGEAIWVTEVWESRASHQASLSLPAVQQAMAKGKPLIAALGERFETQPVGGHGLAAA